MFWFAVGAACALAPLSAPDAQLEALAVAFTAARAFAGASFAMVEPLQFLGEGLRVALGYLGASRCDSRLGLRFVAAVDAATLWAAMDRPCEAFAVELEAPGAGARALACLLAACDFVS